MLQDVEARRQTEIDWLNGGIVALRRRARRADAAQRGDRGAGERGGAIVVREAERRYRLIREAAEREGVDAVIAAGSEYTGFEGAVRLPVRVRHRPPVRARAAAARRGAVGRVPGRGPVRGRARLGVGRGEGLRRHARRVAARARPGARLEAGRRLRARLRDERARLPRAGRGPVRARLRSTSLRPRPGGQERGRAGVGARQRPDQRGRDVGDDPRLRAGQDRGGDHGAVGRAVRRARDRPPRHEHGALGDERPRAPGVQDPQRDAGRRAGRPAALLARDRRPGRALGRGLAAADRRASRPT